MQAALAGDAAAYERLLRDLANVLRSYVRRSLVRARLPVSEVEDVIQETLLAIHLKRHTWDTRVPITPWVLAITHHKLVDLLRRRRRHVNLSIEEIQDHPAEDNAAPATQGELDRHLATLSARQREVIRAIALGGASIREAAKQLGTSEGAIRVALHRGLAALAAKLRGP
jgi:RNA polymerase sigma-70 factor (ECF subfamily)